jgi:hypothetical protein
MRRRKEGRIVTCAIIAITTITVRISVCRHRHQGRRAVRRFRHLHRIRKINEKRKR